MNTTYIICFAIVSIIAIYTFICQDEWHESCKGWKVLTGIGSFFGFFIMLGVSFAPLGKKTTLISKANAQRIGDQIVVQVDKWPIQITSDVKYLDKPLSLTKTTQSNAWGFEYYPEYTISELMLPEAH